MRIPIGNTLRVGPGDQVFIRGRLPADAKLGRLFVFASENGADFSPYVLNVADTIVEDGKPQMLTPLALRLVSERPDREISFAADIDGFVRVMQEVDTDADPHVKVKLTRRVNPNLGWSAWIQRKLTSWQTPKLSS